MNNELIKIEHVSYKYERENVLEDINLSVKDGDFLAVIKISETPQKNFSVSQQIYILDEKMREYIERPRAKRSRKHNGSSKRKSAKSGKTVTAND